MNDLQFGMGMLNAQRNAARARELAQNSLHEAQKAARYARDTAAAEQQRLALEEERFAAEQEHLAAEKYEKLLRQQGEQEQQRTRELLADALNELEELTEQPTRATGTQTAVAWRRNIAVLECKLSILDGRQE